jgi:hypothetical protein
MVCPRFLGFSSPIRSFLQEKKVKWGLDRSLRRLPLVEVVFDPTGEPDFHGGLSVDVVGRGAENVVYFRTRVELEVQPQLGR